GKGSLSAGGGGAHGRNAAAPPERHSVPLLYLPAHRGRGDGAVSADFFIVCTGGDGLHLRPRAGGDAAGGGGGRRARDAAAVRAVGSLRKPPGRRGALGRIGASGAFGARQRVCGASSADSGVR